MNGIAYIYLTAANWNLEKKNWWALKSETGEVNKIQTDFQTAIKYQMITVFKNVKLWKWNENKIYDQKNDNKKMEWFFGDSFYFADRITNKKNISNFGQFLNMEWLHWCRATPDVCRIFPPCMFALNCGTTFVTSFAAEYSINFWLHF